MAKKTTKGFQLAKEEDDEDGAWRTINGRAIFIKSGEDLESAMERSGKFDKGEIKDEIKDGGTDKGGADKGGESNVGSKSLGNVWRALKSGSTKNASTEFTPGNANVGETLTVKRDLRSVEQTLTDRGYERIGGTAFQTHMKAPDGTKITVGMIDSDTTRVYETPKSSTDKSYKEMSSSERIALSHDIYRKLGFNPDKRHNVPGRVAQNVSALLNQGYSPDDVVKHVKRFREEEIKGLGAEAAKKYGSGKKLSRSVVLNAGHGDAVVEDQIDGAPSQLLGQPVKYMWKTLLTAGDYRHPDKKDWRLSVDTARLDRLVENFRKARDTAGFKAFVPTKHRNFDAKDNMGWVVELKRNGDKLLGLHQLIGDDAIKAAARNESSVCIRPFRDRNGVEYDEMLVHNALVPDPVATGLGGFVEMSASAAVSGQQEERVPVLYLSAASGESSMDLLEQLRELLGADMTEEQALEEIKRLQGEANKVESLSRQLTASKAQVTELSRTTGKRTDPEVLVERGARLNERLSNLVKAGKFSAKYADRLKKALINAGDEPNEMMLSRGEGQADCLAAQLLDLISELEPGPKMGEKTGGQVFQLGRSTPGADDEAEVEKARKEAEAYAKRTQK